MSSLNKTSTLVQSQLPGFIIDNPDYTLFVQFLEKYYEFLELEGNPIYELRRIQENYDVDSARKFLLQYFKSKILPSFPDETELSTEKIIKASRDFYAKKGTADSFKFLFRILYGQEVSVFLPKTNILRASDGKWERPQALRISLGDSSYKLAGNVKVFAANSNVVSYAGNLASTGLTQNNYVRISAEKRRVTAINTAANTFNVDLKFANTAYSNLSGVIYEQGNTIYRIVPSDNIGFDFDLLKNNQVVGANSRATCLIENYYRTYDRDSGQEVVELFVTNVNREFELGEFINVKYKDSTGNTKTYSTKVISSISKIYLEKDRFNKSLGGNRYVTGDPVVFYDGLDRNTDLAKHAIATVDETSEGGIGDVRLLKPGYFFRTFANGSLIQIQSPTGVGANLIISEIYTDAQNANTFRFSTDSIVYKSGIQLNAIDFEFENVASNIGFTIGAGNSTTTANLQTATFTASATNNAYSSIVFSITAGTGAGQSATISSYNGTTKIATFATPLSVAPNSTSMGKLTANATTEIGKALAFESFVMGKIENLDLVQIGSSFADIPTFQAVSTFDTDLSVDSDLDYFSGSNLYNYDALATPYPTIKLNSTYNPTRLIPNSANNLSDGFYTGTRFFVNTGNKAHYVDVVDYAVSNPTTSANVKTLFLARPFESNITSRNINRFSFAFDFRGNVQNMGLIGGVEVFDGGAGYNASDRIIFVGTGTGGSASIVVDTSGKIVGTTMRSYGEGYYGETTAVVVRNNGTPTSGSGATFKVWGLSDGESITSEISEIGQIKTFKIKNRGYGYVNKPNVSLKIVDVFVNNTNGLENKLSVGDTVWQNTTANTMISGNANATFTAIVSEIYDIPNSQNTIIRLYNYNGSLTNTNLIYANTRTTAFGNISCNVMPYTGTFSFKNIYDSVERDYPYYYGNGLAKAQTEFLNGLVKYDGYYLNTDGFPSADQRLQDANYYHNYSYEIQSEKSLDDYRATIFDVAHPAGTKLLGKYLVKDELNVSLQRTSNACISNATSTGIISATHANNVLYGSGAANLALRANVGDLIVINTSANANQQFVKTITSVSPTVQYDSPIGRFSDGYLQLNYQSALATVYGNTFPITETLQVGDAIRVYALDNGVPIGAAANVSIINIANSEVTFGNIWLYETQNSNYRILTTLTDVPYRLIKTIG